MGSGQYGGNGSVHWFVQNQRDKAHKKGHHKHNGVDEFPGKADGGDFIVQVFDIDESGFSWADGVLTATLPIKHGKSFTRQIEVSWPDPPPSKTSSAVAASRKKASAGKKKKR